MNRPAYGNQKRRVDPQRNGDAKENGQGPTGTSRRKALQVLGAATLGGVAVLALEPKETVAKGPVEKALHEADLYGFHHLAG